MSSAVVFGARNLGRAIAADLIGRGHRVAVASRGEESLARVKSELPDVVTLQADAGNAADVSRTFEAATKEFGQLDLVVTAISPSRGGGGLSRGSIAELEPAALESYSHDLLPALFTVLTTAGRVMREQGSGTYIQVTGGSSRRGMSGLAPWAAGAFATRGMIQAAASELREHGVHVALLIVDATIESPKTAERLKGKDPILSTTEEDVAEAVAYLAGQSERAWTHELQLTPRGDRWVP